MHKQRHTMSDLDIQLIKEFALRPIIYNKATPFFKNKYLTDCAWDEIAAKVGGDVVRVRDRINQLRNRYNLEKRKVDIQKAEGYSNARSTWPLFDNLRFLDGHIRPRKSYKCMVRRTRPVGRPRRNHHHSNDSFVTYNDDAHSTQYANPIALQHQQQQHQQQQQHPNQHQQQGVRIKYEPDSGIVHPNDPDAMYQSGYESDGDGDCNYAETSSHLNDQKSNSDGENFINPASFLVENEESASDNQMKQLEANRDTHNNLSACTSSQNSETIAMNSQKNHSLNLTLRNLNSMKDQQAANGEGSRNLTSTSIIAIDSESQSSMQNHSYHRNRLKHYPSPIAKFEAFGNFVASSLTDLPEQNALELVEKFTSELVKALISKSTPKE